ncbi:MAG: hypothetical protein CSA73_00270 [Rhodobacterales bacterium]|nr:MAG: hypothetical protein CSA73_00270 [Rhodobacterales bacterium]
MSDTSVHLSLPYLQASQAQKHVTHNEALRLLDSIVQLSVISADQTTPPAAPQDGDRYLLPAGVTGVWAGHEGHVAIWDDSAWSFLSPAEGWLAWVSDTDQLRAHDGNAWGAVSGDMQNLDLVGVNTTADSNNRLSVAAANTLLTHEGAGHRLKINKAAEAETASLLTAGSDDFQIKVSADGSSFHQSLVADAQTGVVRFPSGVEGLTPPEFGTGELVSTSYLNAQRPGQVANATGLLGSNYNYPPSFAYDPAIAPNLPAAFRHDGYYPGRVEMAEPLAVDPNQVYRLESYLRQESTAGDWSAFAHGERHRHDMGLIFLDADGQEIDPRHHMRYRHNGTDSMTTLAAPLSPGDTTVQLTDASGWNEADPQTEKRGLAILAYKAPGGQRYSHYSRLVEFGLFDLGQVNKGTGTVTLNQPLPASLGNPEDGNGTWPAGTPIANSDSSDAPRAAFYSTPALTDPDQWYRSRAHIGGVDLSGTNAPFNFPPGTACVRVFWLPNYSNRPGGWSGYPDTGAGHSVWFSGVSVLPEALAAQDRVASGASSGMVDLLVPVTDFATGAMSLSPPGAVLTAL